MKTHALLLPLFFCISLASSAQSTQIGFQPGATFIEVGDMWAGQFSVFIERDLNNQFSLGGILEGLYGTQPNSLLTFGDETIITNRGTGYLYDPNDAVWREGFWQIEGSATKQMSIGIGPRASYHVLSKNGHHISISADVLFRYNDQMYMRSMVTGYWQNGDQVLIATPVLWTYFDIASSLSVSYNYRLTEHFFIGTFGRMRISMDAYQYGSFGFTSGFTF